MIFLIAVGVILLPLLLGGLIAWGSSRFDHVVETTKEEVENVDKGFNPTVTFGHEIKADAAPEEMLKQARLEAARKAAITPRGANMRIGRKGHVNLRTAGSALDEDPVTAVRIAMYHGWDGARTGAVAAVATPAAAPAAAAAQSVDIQPPQYIEITDDTPPEEVRKARIANSKARSAFNKALKAAGVDPNDVEIVNGKVVMQGGGPVVTAASAPAAGAVSPAGAAPAAPQSVNIEPPQLIEITDDMPPDEVRAARIANSKAKSAFNKALKAAGVDPSDVEVVDGKVVVAGGEPVVAAAPAAQEAPAAAPASAAPGPAAAAANIPKPELIEITDEMSPDEIRSARIANSKAKSAYNKALKAAGIDPKSVN
jgi:hypothetical protein